MRAALNKVDRDIVYSLCQYGMGDVWKWGEEIGGNCWRTTGDIGDSWSSMGWHWFRPRMATKNTRDRGHWNDPDMLVVGQVGWGQLASHESHAQRTIYTHQPLELAVFRRC